MAKSKKSKGILQGVLVEDAPKQLKLGEIASRTAIKTAFDVLGALAGGAIGSMTEMKGIPYSGVVVNAMGNWFRIPLLSSFGVGLVASIPAKSLKGLDGTEGGPLDRLKAYGKMTAEKFFLDKILGLDKPQAAATPQATNGMGEVNYYSYPDGTNGVGELGAGEIDYSALDKITKQIADSGQQYSKEMNGELAGMLAAIDGTDEDLISGLGAIDPSERNY